MLTFGILDLQAVEGTLGFLVLTQTKLRVGDAVDRFGRFGSRREARQQRMPGLEGLLVVLQPIVTIGLVGEGGGGGRILGVLGEEVVELLQSVLVLVLVEVDASDGEAVGALLAVAVGSKLFKD